MRKHQSKRLISLLLALVLCLGLAVPVSAADTGNFSAAVYLRMYLFVLIL